MRSLRIYIISLAVIIIIYLVAQYNRPKDVNWSETFSSNDKIPYGTYIIYNRLNDIFPGAKVQTLREPIYNVINDGQITHATYLIISNAVDLNEYDYKKLIQFIKNGNDVFISASYFGDELKKELKIETAVEFKNFKSSVGLKFISKQLDTNNIYHTTKGMGDIYFSQLDTAAIVALGSNTNGHINFLKYSTGKGNLFLNANPRMFTNYSLFSKQGSEYASTALSFVKDDKTLIWDQYYAVGREDEGSSMRVFLRNSDLRWAFYIAFFSLIVFVLYEMKRRQRIIPVIEPLENSTLNFVNVVGQVYYEQHDNRNISNKKILYFLEHLRTQYNLKTSSLDREFIDNFSRKTGIENDFATELINHINYLSTAPEVTNPELVKLNRLIEQFYNQSA
ncbi:MAG: hypothetical protein JWQ66_88 [Mucilaginibacter sp.]|nr:hypothetical protein [Mucilaginibacter sp.]